MTSDQDDSLLGVVDANATLIAAIVGYRAMLTESGFSPEAVEQMTIDYHRAFINKVLDR